MKKKVLAFSGSLRSQSFNLKLVRSLCKLLEQDGAFECKTLQASDLELPLLSEDKENPLPASVVNFRAQLQEADFIVISSPEYNGGYSSALKNAIDWATRPPENLWAGKVVLLMAASPGGFGGIRGLIQVRTILSGIKSWVLPEQVLCPAAHTAFAEDGSLKNEAVLKQMQAAIASYKDFIAP